MIMAVCQLRQEAADKNANASQGEDTSVVTSVANMPRRPSTQAPRKNSVHRANGDAGIWPLFLRSNFRGIMIYELLLLLLLLFLLSRHE
jgi:hypothetical protein